MRHARRAFTWLAALALLSTALAGCDQKPVFDNPELSGNTSFASDFALPDTHGRLRTIADYRGKVVVLFFGYLHCPDVCPTTMAELAQAMTQLGSDAGKVQVLFVTVDPQRDTPQALDAYVTAFNPSFAGLRPADAAQLTAVTKGFHVYVAKDPATATGDYTITHTGASYVFDPDGKLRLFARDGQGAAPWVHDIRLLLK
ncbi:MAG: SCO family protein [Janthinobacterium lividum]